MKTDPLKTISEEIKKYFPTTSLNYGEGHEVIAENQGANYASIQDERPCSVDDNYDLVLFFVRVNSSPTEENGRGLKQKLSRDVNFKLVANSKTGNFEYNLNFILNNISEIELGETDNSAKAIAQNFFGVQDHNFETYFFTIDFSAKETIDCLEC